MCRYCRQSVNLDVKMEEMIASKHLAGLSHDHARIDGPDSPKVRDLFDNPELFVKELGASRRLVVPGHPDDSQLIKDMQFGGPMFRVFTEEEQALVRAWISGLLPVLATETGKKRSRVNAVDVSGAVSLVAVADTAAAAHGMVLPRLAK